MIQNKEQKPLISNKNADAVRFEIPSQPNFPIIGSILSILSLLLLSGLGLYMFIHLKEQPNWIRLPFLFTVFGGTVGWLLELGLLFNGTPFQFSLTRFTRFVRQIRLLNIGPVVTTLFLFATTIVITDPDLHFALLYVGVFLCFALVPALYYGGAASVPLVILGTQILQLIIILIYGAQVGGHLVTWMLIGQTVIQFSAFIVGTTTPMKSFGFHVLSSISGTLAYFAITTILKEDSDFGVNNAVFIPSGSLQLWALIFTAIIGFLFTMKASAPTFAIWRSKVSNTIWSLQYFLIISAKRFPKPYNLSFLYKDGAPPPTRLQPYYLQHSEFLPEKLVIPSVERIEGNVTAFNKLVVKAKKAFTLIAMLDHVFPQADSNVPLSIKPRMNIWSNGSDIYPRIYTKKIFGYSLPIQHFKKTPEPALEAFKKGQLLAYLGEFGIANPFLKPAPNKEKGTLVMDFRFLEKYETKPDYESYGGMAYFKVNSQEKKLELISVVAPNTTQELIVNTMDPTYRRAESMVLASMYYQVISGKHLAGIHMIYNLVEAVLHNAFDAQGQFNHPVRTFMYLHLFSHELAEEMTTEHLVQKGAVFTQVFATTFDGLIDHLNDCYHDFQYCDDEDFESRYDNLLMEDNNVLPNACINWELKYVAIWNEYTDDLMNIIYASDEEVQNDKYMQDVHRGLLEVMLNGLPARYDNFQTIKGVSRWASDTIHHIVVRHQVYGTSGIRAAMDPRISVTQVPKDAGTQGVDEWRSLIGVGLATACARFTLLVGKDGENFTYLLDGVDEKYKNKMAPVFVALQEKLLALDKEWTKDYVEEEFNYDFFRPTPSDMRTGAGY